MNVCQGCPSQHLKARLIIGYARNNTIVFNADQQLSPVSIGEGHQGLPDVTCYVRNRAPTFWSGSTVVTAFELAKMALPQDEGITNPFF